MEGPACADTGARTTIGASGNLSRLLVLIVLVSVCEVLNDYVWIYFTKFWLKEKIINKIDTFQRHHYLQMYLCMCNAASGAWCMVHVWDFLISAIFWFTVLPVSPSKYNLTDFAELKKYFLTFSKVTVL